jgi:hypothetical protein
MMVDSWVFFGVVIGSVVFFLITQEFFGGRRRQPLAFYMIFIGLWVGAAVFLYPILTGSSPFGSISPGYPTPGEQVTTPTANVSETVTGPTYNYTISKKVDNQAILNTKDLSDLSELRT